jgi:hypothetical protein
VRTVKEIPHALPRTLALTSFKLKLASPLGVLVALSRPRFAAVFPQKRLPSGARALPSGHKISQDRPPSTRRGPYEVW